MAINDKFIGWCEEERAETLGKINLLQQSLTPLSKQSAKERATAVVHEEIARLRRYFHTLGETMQTHREIKGRPEA